MQAVGSRSLGFMMYVFPQMVAIGNIHLQYVSRRMVGFVAGCSLQWNHSGEIEGSDACADTEWGTEAGQIHVLAYLQQVKHIHVTYMAHLRCLIMRP